MALNRFLISFVDNNSGLQNNLRPWLIADNAFAILQNAYIYRGRVRKRFGSTLMGNTQLESRLRIRIGTTAAGTGNFSATVPGTIFAVGQMFSVGNTIFTVRQTGTPAATLSTGNATATYNTNTGALVITGNGENPSTAVYFYPAQPVMGITQYEQTPVNDELSFAWDTQFAYYFDETIGAWERLTGGTATWTGTNSDFFWACNSQGATPNLTLLWCTNYRAADRIRYWNGATWTTPTLIYNNEGSGQNRVLTARIIVSFKNRLLFLNTVESVNGTASTFVSRCRYSGVGSPLEANAWREDIPGNGSALDAPTQEAIVSAQFLKDRLIVFFERSTWELVYIGNQVFPFVWQKINTELGVESTFSQVPFDKVVLGIGQTGIQACNGINVDRIDAKIPQLVFDIHNENGGVERVCGIRDYFPEMVYWSYPGDARDANFPFPNKVLTYNYVNNAWGINDDSFTAFGYYQVGRIIPPDERPYNNLKFKAVIAGNQEGWVSILRIDVPNNSPSLQVTNVVINGPGSLTLTVINHNLSVNDYVLMQNLNGIVITNSEGSIIGGAVGRVTGPFPQNPNVITLQVLDEFEEPCTFQGVYTGGGTLARVSVVDILTKEYNFYAEQNRNAYIPQVNFLVERTLSNSINVDYFVSTGGTSIVADGMTTGSLLGTSVLQTYPYDVNLAPLEQVQSRLWHPVYLQAEGECIQLRLYLGPKQLFNTENIFEDFQLHAMLFLAQPTASRLS